MSILDRIAKLAGYMPAGPAPAAIGGTDTAPAQGNLFREIAWADPYRLYQGMGRLMPFNPSLLVTRKGLAIFDQIRKDEQVKAAMKLKKYAVLKSGWDIKSPDGKPDDWEVTLYVREMLDNMHWSFEKNIERIMSAFDYGYSVSEKIWEERDGKIYLCELKDRKPHYFLFDVDPFGNLKSLNQLGQTMEPVTKLPPDKFVLYAYQYEFGNWYGTSDLESAYRAWWLKDNAYKWLAIMLERYGMPPIFMMYNPNKYVNNQLSTLQTVIQGIQNATAGLIPRAAKDDLEPWSPNLAANAKDVFLPAIDKLDRDMARAILMPSLIGFTPDDGRGAQARSEQHFDAFLMIVEAVRDELCGHVIQEQIIKPACDLNFPNLTEYPEFSFEPIKEDLKLEIFQRWGEMVDKGITSPQDEDETHIREVLKFPPLDLTAAKERGDRKAQEAIDNAPPDPNGPGGGDPNLPKPGETALKDEGGVVRYFAAAPAFDAIASQLDSLEALGLKRLREVISTMQDALVQSCVKQLNSGEGPKFVNGLRLQKRQDLQLGIYEVLRRAFDAGMSAAKGEVRAARRSFDARGAFAPTGALKWLSQRAVTVAGVLADHLLGEVKVTLLNALKNGEPLSTTVEKLADIFLDYIGNDDVLADGEALSPFRLETIVRTNTTEAYNHGRLTRFIDKDVLPYIVAVRYSAVLDSRTTEVCKFLDGKLFKPESQALKELIPPNHFNCRSILVPIVVGTKVDETEFITVDQIGKAKSLAGNGFA
jgi:SPP1 gp7 family putative phage head morphogenesis protein